MSYEAREALAPERRAFRQGAGLARREDVHPARGRAADRATLPNIGVGGTDYPCSCRPMPIPYLFESV